MKELRPTPDRTRETLFNWLQIRITGAICLDLFAGTGALGFEAASREAKKVVMIEHQKSLCDQINQNIKLLMADNIDVINADAMEWLETCDQKYDLVFMDPPFYRNIHENVCATLLEKDLLLPDARVYMESEPDVSVPDGYITEKEARAGQVIFRLLKKQQD